MRIFLTFLVFLIATVLLLSTIAFQQELDRFEITLDEISLSVQKINSKLETLEESYGQEQRANAKGKRDSDLQDQQVVAL